MRAALCSILALGAIAMFNSTPAAARDYPFCLMGRDFAGTGDCKFDTLAQCQASASGRQAICAANPYPGYFDGLAAAPSKRRIVR